MWLNVLLLREGAQRSVAFFLQALMHLCIENFITSQNLLESLFKEFLSLAEQLQYEHSFATL